MSFAFDAADVPIESLRVVFPTCRFSVRLCVSDVLLTVAL